MRRLLTLVPVLALAFVTAIPAQASTPLPSETISCRWKDAGTISATVKWDDTTDPNVHLLHRFTVNSGCTDSWVELFFRGAPGRNAEPKSFWLWVQPGTIRTVGNQGLEKLGIYQRPFFTWHLAIGFESRHQPGTCPTRHADTYYIMLANGRILTCPESL